MRKSGVAGFFLLAGLLAAWPAGAVTNRLTTATTISGSDFSKDNSDLVIDACKVTVNGSHTFRSLSLLNAAVLTHSDCTATAVYKLDLVISNTLLVDATSKIDVIGKGYIGGRTMGNSTNGAACGLAGGSYGGCGNAHYNNTIELPNEPYGFYRDPAEPGAGGGPGTFFDVGAPGGGLVRIVANRMTLNGLINANGGPAVQDMGGGIDPPPFLPAPGSLSDGGDPQPLEFVMYSTCGAGGGISLRTGILEGSGSITANGGAFDPLMPGGSGECGGGGRVAVYYETASGFNLSKVQALPGKMDSPMTTAAAPGTVYLKPKSSGGTVKVDSVGQLTAIDMMGEFSGAYTTLGRSGFTVIQEDNVLLSGTNVAVQMERTLPWVVGSLVVTNGAKLVAAPYRDGVVGSIRLTATGQVVVAAGSMLDAAGCGYPAGLRWPGVTEGASTGIAGGSYGGMGNGASPFDALPSQANETYGDFRDPFEGGSGGASFGMPGGGIVRISTPSLVVDGRIRADGGDMLIPPVQGEGGGGSGGAIRLDVDVLSGRGSVSANGAYSIPGRDGGGGRIAVYYRTLAGFAVSNLTAHGGCQVSSMDAAAVGTVYLAPSNGTPKLVVSSHGWRMGWFMSANGDSGAVTPVRLPKEGGALNVEVSGPGVIAVPQDGATLWCDSLVTENGGRVMPPASTVSQVQPLEIWARSNLLLRAASGIDGTGCGYWAGRAQGGDLQGGARGNAGGSHGGLGAIKGTGVPNACYGDAVCPMTAGAGGGLGVDSARGGGIVRVFAPEILADGFIRSDGQSADTYPATRSGGAGGSVLVNCERLAGAGLITASGGFGAYGGGGGGGRVAVYTAQTRTLPASAVRAAGGTTYQGTPGTTGTVHLAAHGFFGFVEPRLDQVHGVTPVKWSALGLSAAQAGYVRVRQISAGVVTVLADQAPELGEIAWDTRELVTGMHELRLEYVGADGLVLAHQERVVFVNNDLLWHGGLLTQSETWGSGTVHVVESPLVLAANVTVTIEPGAVIKFAPNSSITVRQGGSLIVLGRATLTSLSDDTAGGDSNLDGDRSHARGGDWVGLTALSGATVSGLDLLDIRYLLQTHAGTLAPGEVWSGTALHIVASNGVTVAAGASLTIRPGAVVKFMHGGKINALSGSRIDALGTVTQPIFFTSHADDTVGGDVNGNGNLSAPQAGDWNGIRIDGGAGVFTHCDFRYGGGPVNAEGWGLPESDGKYTLKVLGGGSLVVRDALLLDSAYDGVLVWNAAGTIESSVFAGCDRALCSYPSATVRISNVTCEDNRTGILAYGGQVEVRNTIVSGSPLVGVEFAHSGGGVFSSCCFWNTNNFIGCGTEGGFMVADPLFRDAAQRNYRLQPGSPCVDTADGTLAPATDLMGAPRVSDPRVTSGQGTATSTGAYADIGAYERTDDAESEMDIVVNWITGPEQGVAGTAGTVRYELANRGTKPVVGPWHDRVALVADVPSRGVGELDCGVALVDLTLSPGERKVVERSVPVIPGGTPGTWRWRVHANTRGEIFEGRNWNNNLSALSAPMRLTVPALTVGAVYTNTFRGVGQPAWFEVTARELQISLDSAADSGHMRMYIGLDSMPTVQDFDWRSIENSLVDFSIGIPAGVQGRTLYGLLVPERFTGSPDFSLTASAAVFGLKSLGLARAGNCGDARLPLVGSGFHRGMCVELRQQPSGAVAAASLEVFLRDAAHAWAALDLRGVIPGVYDVAAVPEVGEACVLVGAFEVVAGKGADLKITLEVPEVVRSGRPFTGVIEYENAGDVDMPTPLLILESEFGDPVWLLGSSSTGQVSDTLQVLAIANDGSPCDVLKPGGRGTVTFQSVCTRVMGTRGAYSVDWVPGDSAFPADYAGMRALMFRPPSVSVADWEAVWNRLALTRPTLGMYLLGLAEISQDWQDAGQSSVEVLSLFQDLLSREWVALPGASLAGTVKSAADGRPVSQARLVVLDDRFNMYEGVTTVAGEFAFRNLPDGVYSLQVPGRVLPEQTVVSVPRTEALEVIVSAGGSLGGRVSESAKGLGVSNVSVVFELDGVMRRDCPMTLTDVEGRYLFTGLSTGTGTVSFLPPRHVQPEPVTVSLKEGEVSTLSIQLEAGAVITGRVGIAHADNSFTPVSVQRVTAYAANGREVCRSALTNGVYALEGLKDGTYTVRAQAASGWCLATGLVARADLPLVRDLPLLAESSVFGQVYDATTRAPLTAFGVRAVPFRGSGPALIDGNSYALRNLEPGVYTLQAAAEGYLMATARVSVVQSAMLYTNFYLRPAGLISGTVRAGGSPATGFEAVLWPAPEGERSVAVAADGTFAFAGLPDAMFCVALRRNGAIVDQRTFTLSAQSNRYDVAFSVADCHISGRVAASAGTNSAVVVLLMSGSNVVQRMTSDASGAYAFDVSATGRYDVVAAGVDVGYVRAAGIQVTGATNRMELATLVGTGSVIRVVCRCPEIGSNALANVSVTLAPTNLTDVLPMMAFSGTNGLAEFSVVPAGTYDLRLHAGGYVPKKLRFTAGAAGAVVTGDVARASLVRGSVTGTDGHPCPMAWIGFDDGAGQTGFTLSGEDGTFVVDTLAEGTATFWAYEAPAALAVSTGIWTRVEYPAQVDFILGTNGFSVTGAATDAHGVPLLAARASLLLANGLACAKVTPDWDGTFRFGPLPAGSYRVRVEQAGAVAFEQAFTLTGNIALGALSVRRGLMGAYPADRWFKSDLISGILAPQLVHPDSPSWRNQHNDLYFGYLQRTERSARKDDAVKAQYDVCCRLSEDMGLRFSDWDYSYDVLVENNWLGVGYVGLNSTLLGLKIAKLMAMSTLPDTKLWENNPLMKYFAGTQFLNGDAARDLKETSELINKVVLPKFEKAFEKLGTVLDDGTAPDNKKFLAPLDEVFQMMKTVGPQVKKVIDYFRRNGNAAVVLDGFGKFMDIWDMAQEIYNYQASLENEVNRPAEAGMSAYSLGQFNYLRARNNYYAAVLYLKKLINEWDDKTKPPPKPPKPFRKPGPRKETDIRNSMDPNDKLTVGYGPQKYVQPGQRLFYTIRFENMTNAALPAAMITVDDDLTDRLDWKTLELSSIGFNRVEVQIPPGLQYFSAVTNVQTDVYPVQVVAAFDASAGHLSWVISSFDRVTSDLPADPFAGFLPPNTNAPSGEGFVSYFVNVKSDLADGMQVTNMARIVFDANLAINTPSVTNTIDVSPPSSHLTDVVLAAGTEPSVRVAWGGSDVGAGLESYDVYVSRDGANYERWLERATGSESLYNGEPGVRYRFYTVGRDGVGNREREPSAYREIVTPFRLKQFRWQSGENRSVLTWQSATGKVYRVWTGTNLVGDAGVWSAELPSTPPENTHTAIVDHAESRFFRILATP